MSHFSDLGRFQREQSAAPNLPASLETVAADLASSLETYVKTIVDSAENRASEVEREAEQAAIQKEQESQRRAQEILDAVVTRTSRLLGSIELVESSLRGMIGGLRAELETMTTDLAEQQGVDILETRSPGSVDQETAARPGPDEPSADDAAPPGPWARTPVPEHTSDATIREKGDAARDAQKADRDVPIEAKAAPPAPAAAENGSDAPVAPETDRESLHAPDPIQQHDHAPATPFNMPIRSETRDDTPPGAAAEFDQMIHAKSQEMIRNGKSRKDVERFLRRFKRGKQYIEQLDRMFAEQVHIAPPRQGGMFRRLWRRQ